MEAHQRLLIIDDEPAVLKLVKTMLSRANYEVVTTASSSEALKLIKENFFDLVITDAVMPMISGYDLVKAIRRLPDHTNLPVLMLTRKRHRQDVKKAVEAGVTDYVLKPIDEHLLLDKVELCLKKGEGTRHVFELSLEGERAMTQVAFECRMVSISESGFAIRSPIPLFDEPAPLVTSKLFAEIGVTAPLFKFVRCDEVPVDPGMKELPYEVKFAFFGLPEAELKKVRAWVQRESIRRKK